MVITILASDLISNMKVNYHIYERSRLDKFLGEFMGGYFLVGSVYQIIVQSF